jgi:outer membrane protein TolC
MIQASKLITRGIMLATVFTVTGCVSFSPDGGFSTVESIVKSTIDKDVGWARSDAERVSIDARVAELLGKTLSVDDAVQLALLNNRGLQAAFFELGISESDLVRAGRLPNPHFSLFRASRVEHGEREYKIEQALTFNIFALITMPQALAVERRRFEQVKRQLSMDVLTLASETRKAYFHAVAANETVRYMRQVKDVADASAELARRMAQVGNWNRLNQAREHGFYADAALNLARAEQAAVSARERLTRLLGLWGQQTSFKLPERLPELPTALAELPSIEQQAMESRLDLLAIRLQTEALANNLGLTRTTRFINVFEFGPARVLEGTRDAPYKYGYEVSFELPIFDWGGAKVARAEAIYMQAVNRAAESAINARSEVREAYQAYRIAHDIAKHYRDEIVPIRKRIADENLLRYNGMLIGVFDLLADARAQIASVNSYIESLRDYWLAQSDLEMSKVGKPVMTSMPKAAAGEVRAAGH